MNAARPGGACEFRRKAAPILAALAVILAAPSSAPWGAVRDGFVVHAAAAVEQPHTASPAAPAESREEHESVWPLIARLVNFGILAGALVYLLRSPFGQYITGRAAAIRQDLLTAAEMRRAAAAQLEAINRRLQALPQDLEDLKARGGEEIAAEESRISQAAEAERQRLLEQTRREIDLQLRAAKKELVRYAAELAVGSASERIKRSITPGDHMRLVDQYTDRVEASEP